MSSPPVKVIQGIASLPIAEVPEGSRHASPPYKELERGGASDKP